MMITDYKKDKHLPRFESELLGELVRILQNCDHLVRLIPSSTNGIP